MYDRSFTATEGQALAPTAGAPPLAAEIRVLQVLIYWLLTLGPALAHPRNRRRRAAVRRWQHTVLLQQIAAIGRACDVLQRLLKPRQTLARDSPSELIHPRPRAGTTAGPPPRPPVATGGP